MEEVLRVARLRSKISTSNLEDAKPVPTKHGSRLSDLQKRFDLLVGTHTQTEALLAAGGGDLPVSLQPFHTAPPAALPLPLPPRSAGGTPCCATATAAQPGFERGPRLRLQPSLSTPALRRPPQPSPGPQGRSPAYSGCSPVHWSVPPCTPSPAVGAPSLSTPQPVARSSL